jgi:hypothetical protein
MRNLPVAGNSDLRSLITGKADAGDPVVLEPLVASAEPLNAQLWPNNKIVQNRLALLGKESVSVGHRRHPLSG